MTRTALIAPQMRAANPASTLVGALAIAGLGCLAIITCVHPGATRMYASPWSWATAGALLAPALILVCRAFLSQHSLHLPAPAWRRVAAAALLVPTLSAAFSPYPAFCLTWSAPLLAAVGVFFIASDWLAAGSAAGNLRRTRLLTGLGGALAIVAVISLGHWLQSALAHGFGRALAARNGFPLGHSNYTAGIGLLLLPVAVAVVLRTAGAMRLASSGAAALALALIFTSGSRGALLGLLAAGVAGAALLPFSWRRKLTVGALFVALVGAFVVANPRTRAWLEPTPPGAPPNLSDVQRHAMLVAAARMGADRPLLGWGPGTTPLVYPRYRAGLDGGVENAFQLHSTPAQLWAELGFAGAAVALAALGLVAAGARREPAAFAALVGYGVFSLFDWQLEVPVFGFTIATLLALLAAPDRAARPVVGRALGFAALVLLASVVIWARRDPAPVLNARALPADRSTVTDAASIALLRESLGLNAEQEIAHFNLGWLLVVSDPPAAERHFRSAARLVPDKGGVYFGLGLALLNQGHSEKAAAAFALECLNDPAFLASPWWNEPAIAATRDATAAAFAEFAQRLRGQLLPGSWAAQQLERVAAMQPRLGRVPEAPQRAYRRERPGYPVLMRNLDIPTPVDVFVVREFAAPPWPELAALPSKGWLPSPLLRRLLEESLSPKP